MAASAEVSYPAEGVGLVLIDNPPMNFNTVELRREMYDAVIEVKEAGCVVVVVASDRPGYFIAHASLQGIIDRYTAPTSPIGGAPLRPDLAAEIEEGPMISIAANNGQAWGGGAEFSWAFNLRIAAESATYGQPEVALGIIPGAGGTTRLARLIGPTKCMEMILDGRPITAREAMALGAINKVVPDDRLREETIAWAAHIAQWPAWALEACKRSLIQGRDLPLSAARRNEQQIFRQVASREDSLEIMRAAQAKYDAGADSYDAIGIPRS